MTTWTILEESHDALRKVVRGLADTDWNRPTPCTDWDVTQVFQHVVGDQIAYAAFIIGGPGPAENPFDPSGVLPDRPHDLLEDALAQSANAWATVAQDEETVPVPIPPNKLTAELGVAACAHDAAVHAWDLAVATGQPSPLSQNLARQLMPALRQLVEPLRGFAFAPALEPATDADKVAKLLAFLGRRPDWSP